MVIVYVEDILISNNSENAFSSLISKLELYFKVRYLGKPQLFFGIEIERSSSGISLLDCKPSYVHVDLTFMLAFDNGDLLPNAESYRCLIGTHIPYHHTS